MDRKIIELLLQNKSQREIRSALRVGDRRIRQLRALAERYGYLDAEGNPGTAPLPPYPEALFPDGPEGAAVRSSDADQLLLTRKEWIQERLTLGWHPITVYEELGFAVGRSSFYRFIHRHGLANVGAKVRARVVPEIVHQPGEALILDWGKLRDVVIDGVRRTLWAFIGVLGYSRYMMVRLVWTNDVPTTLAAIESMLQEIGGTPARITSDNPKCFALEASRYEPLLNPAFERFAAHYNQITIECLPPADPEKKGKVERLVPYARRLYEAHGNAWFGLEESQAYIDRKLEIANERKHGTTMRKPIEELLSTEVGALKPLPALAYEPEEVGEAVIRRDGHLRFDNKYYSVEEIHIGKRAMIIANASRVSIYCDGKLIETHERIPADDPSRSKSTKPQHLKPWERELEDHSVYRRRAARLGPDVERMVVKILSEGNGFVDTRRIWGILSLDKKHPPALINEACSQALELGTLSYRAVRGLLKLLPTPAELGRPREGDVHHKIPLNPSRVTHDPGNKFVRPMSVYEEQLRLFDSVESEKSKLIH